jgi:hypothetical protein
MATEVVLLLHAPPVVVLLSVAVWPMHINDEPLIAAGSGLMVTVAVLLQPTPVL